MPTDHGGSTPICGSANLRGPAHIRYLMARRSATTAAQLNASMSFFFSHPPTLFAALILPIRLFLRAPNILHTTIYTDC